MPTEKLAAALAQYNLTPEDLEKAASVRLFQKVAAAQNIDLSTLDGEKVASLYQDFEANVLPQLVDPARSEVAQKIASLTDDQVVDLFAKQAEAEGVNFDQATDEQVKQAFGIFVDQYLPVMAQNDFQVVVPDAEKQAAVEEAQAKLAEVDILGRQMATSFWDQLQKEAAPEGVHVDPPSMQTRLTEAGIRGRDIANKARESRVGQLLTGSNVSRVPGHGVLRTALGIGAHAGEAAEARKVLGARGLAAAPVIAAGAYGAKKLHDRLAKPADNEKKGSVTLNPVDVDILAKLAAAGDLQGLQKAAEEIRKAAEFPPKKDEPEEKDDNKKKREEEEERAKKADAAVEALVEDRAADLAAEWLTANGYAAQAQ